MVPRRSPATCAVLLLLLLAPMGLAIRRLGAADYSWVGPLPDVSTLVCQPAGGESAGPWTMVLEKLQGRAPRPQARSLAREAVAAVDAVGGLYVTLLDTLTAEQRQVLLRPQPDLVDPFFPGINGDTHPLIDYCASALSADGVQELPVTPAPPSSAWSQRSLPMPQAMFWGITRLALGVDGSLAPEQRGRMLGGLRALADAAMEYHRVRVAMWYELDLPPQDPHPQVFAFPPAQELREVKQVLAPLRGGEPSAPPPPPGAVPPPSHAAPRGGVAP